VGPKGATTCVWKSIQGTSWGKKKLVKCIKKVSKQKRKELPRGGNNSVNGKTGREKKRGIMEGVGKKNKKNNQKKEL